MESNTSIPQGIQPIEFSVSKIVVIDETKIWDAHFDDIHFSEQDVINEARVAAQDEAYDYFRSYMNGNLSAVYGYQWGALTSTRLSPNLYSVTSVVDCFMDGFDDDTDIMKYVYGRFSSAFSDDSSISFERTAA